MQYTYARAKSILRKFHVDFTRYGTLSELLGSVPCKRPTILRWIYRYPEVVAEAGSHHAPHLVATYIYELSQRFNSFYQACRVEEKGEVNPLRYLLTKATAKVLQSGLNLLGIQAPEEIVVLFDHWVWLSQIFESNVKRVVSGMLASDWHILPGDR